MLNCFADALLVLPDHWGALAAMKCRAVPRCELTRDVIRREHQMSHGHGSDLQIFSFACSWEKKRKTNKIKQPMIEVHRLPRAMLERVTGSHSYSHGEMRCLFDV